MNENETFNSLITAVKGLAEMDENLLNDDAMKEIMKMVEDQFNPTMIEQSINQIIQNFEDQGLTKVEATDAMNRAQRRALKKKVGAKKYAEMVANGDVVETISETAKKLNYIDLIQKLRKLNEEKENDNGETTTENN